MESVLILIFLLKSTELVYGSCRIDVILDISDGTLHPNGSVEHEDVLYLEEHHFEENGLRKGCICEYKTCVRKCCLSHEGLDDDLSCVDSEGGFRPQIYEEHEEVFTETFHIESENHSWCKGSLFQILPEDGVPKIQKNGHLFIENFDNYTPLQFCVDTFDLNHTILVCEPGSSEAATALEAMPTVGK